MSIEDWLHRKAEDNTHNEILSFLTAVMGVNLLIGGLLMVTIVEGPDWLTSPYTLPQTFSSYIGLILTITGFIILSAGFILIIHYDRKRKWYIKEIEKSSIFEKRKANHKTADHILEEYRVEKKKVN